jgi:hypothetical protein
MPRRFTFAVIFLSFIGVPQVTAANAVSDWWVQAQQDKLQDGVTIGYSFYATLIGTDVQSVTVSTPGAEAIGLGFNPAINRWEVLVNVNTEQALTARFPDGTYTFVATFTDTTTAQSTATLGGPFPSVFPQFTAPAEGEFISETADVVVTWTAWPSPPPGASILFATDVNGSNVTATTHPSTDTSHTIPGGTLASNCGSVGLHLQFSVGGGDHGFKVRTAQRQVKPTCREVKLAEQRAPDGSISGYFFAHLDAANVTGVTVTVPGTGEVLPMTFNDGASSWQTSLPDLTMTDLGALIARFPDGQYVFNITFAGGIPGSSSSLLGGDFPAVFPEITAPVHGSQVDAAQPVEIRWTRWLPAPVAGSFVSGCTETYGCWATSADGTQAVIPAGRLPTGASVRLDVNFVNRNGTGGSKATASWVQVATLGVIRVLDLVVAAGPGGVLDLAVRGADSRLYLNHFTGAAWVGWTALPGATASIPALAASGGGILDLVVRGIDNSIYHNHFDGAAWGGWTALPGATADIPALAASGAGVLDLVVRGIDDGVYHNHFDGAAWGGWTALPGATASIPALAASGTGALDLVVRGIDDGIYHNHYDGTAWGGWTALPGATVSIPSLAASGGGALDLAVRGSDDAVYHNHYDGTTWSGWTFVGGPPASLPALVAE